MSRHELSLSITYCSDWTIPEAVRELFQNAFDAGTCDWDYDAGHQALTIRTDGVVLERKTLLLGVSEKPNTSSLGQFGEGYKIAALVLRRAGLLLQIRTGSEVWTASLVQSRRYGTTILAFDIEGGYEYLDSISFTVGGLTQEDFDEVQRNTLQLHSTDASSRILFEPDEVGRIYVGGLYCTTMQDFKCGYNLSPTFIKMNRDRRVASRFEILWEAGRIWSSQEKSDPTVLPKLVELIEGGAPEVQYVTSHNPSQSLADHIARRFVQQYPNSTPVTDSSELKELEAVGRKGTVVPATVQSLVSWSGAVSFEPLPTYTISDWYEEFSSELSEEAKEKFVDFLN